MEATDHLKTPLLESFVADRQHLINEQDVRVHIYGDGEAQASGHARGIVLEGDVDKALQLGEANDLVEPSGDVQPPQPQNRSIEKDVVAPSQLGVKPGAELE